MLFFAGDSKAVCLPLIQQETEKMQAYYDSHRDILDKVMLHQQTFKDYIEMEVEQICYCIVMHWAVMTTGATSLQLLGITFVKKTGWILWFPVPWGNSYVWSPTRYHIWSNFIPAKYYWQC